MNRSAIACLVTVVPTTLAADIEWTQIGPGGGGWITCLTADPRDADTVYAGCDVGGFYKSTDAGRHWRRLDSGLTAYYVEHILVHPTRASRLFIAGCGGVFRSDDGGEHWRWLRNGFPEPAEYRYSAPVGALCIDPTDPSTLYAGIGFPRRRSLGNGLVYKSTDGGASWQPLNGIAKMAPKTCFFDIAVRPDRSTHLLAATTDGLFASTDGGTHWRRCGRGLGTKPVTDIAFHPRRPQLVLAAAWTPPGEAPWRGGVYRSTDGGESFTSISAGLPQIVGRPGAAAQLTSNFLKLALDPRDPARIYAGSANWVGAGLFRTVDGGAQWERVTRKTRESNMDLGWITMGGEPGIKCVAVSPVDPRRIYIGTSMHIFRSDDGGESWRQCYTEPVRPGWWRTNGLATTCLDQITIDPRDSRRLYFGYADIGLLVSEDGGESFQRRVTGIPWHGDQAPVAVDPARPNVVWCGDAKRRTHRGGVARSDDYGKTWRVVGAGKTGLPNEATLQLVLDPRSPLGQRRLYTIVAGHGVYRSQDEGQSWTAANAGLPNGGVSASRLAMSPRNPSRLVCAVRYQRGASLGGLYLTEDAGHHWNRLNEEPELPDVYDIVIDQANPKALLAAARSYYDHATGKSYHGGVFRSDNGGHHWQLVLEDRFAACVAISPADSRVVYAGLTAHPYHDHCLGGGLRKSTDGGRTWTAENEGLTDTQVNRIVIDPRDPAVLYIGTGGHGAFRGIDRALRR